MFTRAKEGRNVYSGLYLDGIHLPVSRSVSFEEVKYVCERFIELGADEIDIGDTNGQADPKMVYRTFC